MADHESASGPVACTLRPSEMAARRRLWDEVAEAALLGVHATAAGVRLHFCALPGVAEGVRTLARLEEGCCSFAAWSVSDDGDQVVLTVESRGDGVAAVQSMFAAC